MLDFGSSSGSGRRYTVALTNVLSENLKAETWYERLNLFGKLTRFCKFCTGTFWFWAAVAIFTLIEPVLCSNKPVGRIITAQIIVLGVSSALYVIQLIGVASREWEKIIMIQALSASSDSVVPLTDFTPLKILIFFTAEGEYILEFCCLFGGWMTIFVYRGLAVLRCFRVFRLLWFYEVEVFKTNVEIGLAPLVGRKFVVRLFKVLKFAIKALSALGNEMFRLTDKTRGGLLLMCIFFYSAFVLGTTLWIETDGLDAACNSFQSCSYTLMRLTFYDGTGFDFAYTLTEKHRFLFFLLIVYMCLTSFGILNGLVGIFGTAFAAASDEAFNDVEDDEEEEEEGNGEDGEGGEDEDGNDRNRSEKVDNLTSLRDLFARESRRGNMDDEESDMSEDSNARPVGVFQRGMSMSRSKQENKKLETKLKGALGSKSSFAMKELAKIASAEAKAQKDKPRRTLKDIVKENSIGVGPAGARPVHPMFAALKNLKAAQEANAVAAEPEPLPSSPARELANLPVVVKKGNKNLHAAVGMFATLKNQKSGKNLLASHGASGSAGNSSGAHASASAGNASGAFKEYLTAQAASSAGAIASATAADVHSINASIHTLQRTVESQNELIISLFRQVQAMNQSLHVIHPGLPEVPTPAEPALHAQQARRNSNFLGFSLGGKSSDGGASTRDHVGDAPASDSAVTSPPAPDRRKAFHVNMNMFHHGTTSHNSSAHEIEHPVQPALAAVPAVHPAAGAVSPGAPAAKERKPLFASLLHGAHPAPSAPTPAQPVAHPLEDTAAQAPAEPSLSRPSSLAAVHPLPLSIDTEEGRSGPPSLSAVHPMPADSGAAGSSTREGQVTRFTPMPEAAGSFTAVSEARSSLDSGSHLEVIDMQDDGSVTFAQQTPASAVLVAASGPTPQPTNATDTTTTSRPASQSKPRKSPLPSRRHFQSNGSQPSSVLGAMGRFTSHNTSIFEDTPEGGQPPAAVDRGRSSPDLMPAGDTLPPLNTTMVMKPQHAEEIPVRPATRKVTDPPLKKASDLTGNPISEKSDETDEAEGGVVREVKSNLSLLD